MLSRALSFATVTLLVGCFAAGSAHAQATNLEAGKTPSQIFAGTCNVCHKSPRGLLKTVPAASLPGFLRQHYTTSSDMAGVLASFLVSNGATDTRYQAKDAPKQDPGKLKPDGKQEANTKPDAKPEQLDRFGRKLHPWRRRKLRSPTPMVASRQPKARAGVPAATPSDMARPGQGPDGAKPDDGQTPAQAATDSKSGGKRSWVGVAGPAKSRRPTRPRATPPRTMPERPRPPKPMPARSRRSPRQLKRQPSLPRANPRRLNPIPRRSMRRRKAHEPKPLRPDPVPAVTPAPAPSATTASGTPEPAASPAAPVAAAAPTPAPAAVTASAPPPPAAPAGPPAPPISQ